MLRAYAYTSKLSRRVNNTVTVESSSLFREIPGFSPGEKCNYSQREYMHLTGIVLGEAQAVSSQRNLRLRYLFRGEKEGKKNTAAALLALSFPFGK